MKKSLLLLLLTFSFCKESATYWNPEGEFPLLEASGKLSTDTAKSFNLQKVDADAQILIINFFAPECKPCIQEVPDLKTIYNTIKDNQKIKFISIGSKITSLYEEDISDTSSIVPEINKFINNHRLPYPSYLGVTKELKNFGLTGFPETFILQRVKNKKWVIKRRFVGVIALKDIEPFIRLQ
jgi:thiol-disulfide isomerase/thioredoxin